MAEVEKQATKGPSFVRATTTVAKPPETNGDLEMEDGRDADEGNDQEIRMSDDEDYFLDDVATKIKAKPVPWEGYQRAGLITSDELALIKRVDRQPRPKVESILVTDGPQYALLYLTLLKKIERVDTMQNILVLMGDCLLGIAHIGQLDTADYRPDHDERVELFLNTAKIDPELPYIPFLKTLESADEWVQLKACQIVTTFMSAEHSELQPFQYSPLLHAISGLIQGSSANGRDVAVQSLEALLPRSEIRRTVWEKPELVKGHSDPGPQMTYQVSFCIWLLTFETEVAKDINKWKLKRQYDIIPILTEAAQSAVKEKVFRVILATFHNLVEKAPASNLPAMLVVKLLPFVKNLSTRKWTDEDIVEDIQFLKEELTANFQSLTTYDEYTSELSSGHLSWSPVHTSDDFWKENASRLSERDNEQLKILIELLKTSNDPIVLAVGCYDIGQYVQFYDRGKK
ncbi:H(+)-transporting V1 sector ATPase subunit H [Serendipita sp. 399]|nr:H(+)-transporting V1 sector ATPase subunit H [Serendipita sp. 399]